MPRRSIHRGGSIHIRGSNVKNVSTGISSNTTFFCCSHSSGEQISNGNGYVTIGKYTFKGKGRNITILDNRWFIDDIEVTPLDSEEGKDKIAAVHKKLLELTNNYLEPSHRDPFKQELFQKLKESLETGNDISAYGRITAFKSTLEIADKNLISQHRTASWIRYLSNVMSLLSIIPALIQAGYSYSKYNSFQFWKPDSLKTVEGCQNEIKNIENWSL